MKIRVLSDLHLDVNAAHSFSLRNNDVFTVLCGDTSGDTAQVIKWAKKNIQNGLIVSGNHLAYTRRSGVCIQDLKNELSAAFPAESAITYLDVNVGVYKKEVNGIIFLGSTLYTDYKLPYCATPSENDQQLNMRLAVHPHRGMNDWHFAPYAKAPFLGQDDQFTYTKLSPEHYLRWFNRTIERFEEELAANEAGDQPKPVVILTHHCPTDRCIQSSYRDSCVNASYVSQLEWFIEKHPSIKAWCCGHIHDQKAIPIERKDGSTCLVVMNARGYCGYFEDTTFNPNTYLDTDTWELVKDPLTKSQEAKMKKRAKEIDLAIASCFIC